MKKIFTLLLVALLSNATMAQKKTDDKELIINAIEKAYVQGIHNAQSVESILKGFHPGFELLGLDQDNHLTKLPIYTWYDLVRNRGTDGDLPEVKTTAKYPLVDITGNAAVVKVELYREGVMVFTDYLSLYKFREGWRIVSKIYQRM